MKKILGIALIILAMVYGNAFAWDPAGAWDSIPVGSATKKGIVELATDAETVTGTATDKVVTPANITAKLAAPGTIGGTTPGAGTFTLLNNSIYNVKAYGATGDGTTDDKTAIETCIATANAAGGGIVFFPKGTYFISAAITMYSNVYFEGVGQNSIIRVNGNYYGFYFEGTAEAVTQNVVIRNLKFLGTGNAAHTSNTLIAMVQYVKQVWVDKCWILNAGYDGLFALGDCKQVFITNNYISGCQDDGLNPGGNSTPATDGTSDVLIQGNYIENVVHDGIHISDHSERISVINNIINTCDYGIGIYNSNYHLIENNIIKSCGAGIGSKSGTCAYLKISGNLIDTTTVGDGIDLQHAPGYSNISNNTIKSVLATKYGIRTLDGDYLNIKGNIVTGTRAISVSDGSNQIIEGNTIPSAVDYGIICGGSSDVGALITNNIIKSGCGYSGIYTNMQNCLISNNTITNIDGTEINDAGVGNNKIINNHTDGTITSPATDLVINPIINMTPGSGTGITVNNSGKNNRQTYQVTTTYAAYTDTDTTKGIVIATLPAKTKLVGVYADTTTKYIGGTINAATLEVGITAEGAAQILEPHDVYADVILAGDADAELGSGMIKATNVQGGYLPSWTGTTAIYATLDSTAGNLNALTQGSTTFYLVTERY